MRSGQYALDVAFADATEEPLPGTWSGRLKPGDKVLMTALLREEETPSQNPEKCPACGRAVLYGPALPGGWLRWYEHASLHSMIAYCNPPPVFTARLASSINGLSTDRTLSPTFVARQHAPSEIQTKVEREMPPEVAPPASLAAHQ